MKITVGADPEFLVAADGFGIVSALELLPGSKHEPFATPNGWVHPDNVTAEIGIHPSDTADGFDQAMQLVMDELAAMLLPAGVRVVEAQAAEINEIFLTDPRAREAGCEPDYCAYTGAMNPSPSLADTCLRVPGGHTHIGMPIAEADKPRLIKACDLFITIPMLHLENPERRKLYGKAGAYRSKPYGVEYRTPSNVWAFKSHRRKWMFNQIDLAAHLYDLSVLPDDLPDVINTHNLSRAAELVKQHGLEPCPV